MGAGDLGRKVIGKDKKKGRLELGFIARWS